MDILLLIAGVLVIAFLLYLGKRARQRRSLAARREQERLEAQAEGHRSMAADHERKAEELRETAEAERQHAQRHQERASEVEPESDR